MGPDPPEAGASGSLPRSLRWWSTVLNPRVLLGVFLGMQLLGLVGVPLGRSGLPCAPTTAVLALLVSLPARLRRARLQRALAEPGDEGIGTSRGSGPAAGGLIKALLLLDLGAAGLAVAGQLGWMPRLTAPLVLNALLLGLGVGFAEELLFRGWLMGELSLLLDR